MYQVCAWYLRRPENGTRSPETRVTNAYEFVVHLGNQNWVLCESSQCSQGLRLQPLFIELLRHAASCHIQSQCL